MVLKLKRCLYGAALLVIGYGGYAAVGPSNAQAIRVVCNCKTVGDCSQPGASCDMNCVGTGGKTGVCSG
jgi:hypothetical protein